MKRLILLAALSGLLAAQASAGLRIDPPGKPNEDIYDLMERLKDGNTPMAKRFEYFAHYSPVVRRAASFSLMREGDKAMPYVMKALKSEDKRVLRAGCDALCGPFGVGMVGRGRKELQAVMTPDIAGRAARLLAKLLDHEDMYVRDGALLALSNCGKAAVPYLDKVAKFRDDPEWWLRSAASKVIKNVGPPEADRYAEAMTRRFLREPHVYPKRRLQEMVTQLVETGGKREEVLKMLAADILARERGYSRYLVLEGLWKLGPRARAVLPAVEKLLQREQQLLARAGSAKKRAAIEKDIAYIQKVRDRIRPPKPKGAGGQR